MKTCTLFLFIEFFAFFHQLYNFLHIDLIHILSDLYLSISFYWRPHAHGIVFAILNSTRSVLTYGKMIGFLILSLYPAILLRSLISSRGFEFLWILYITIHVTCKPRSTPPLTTRTLCTSFSRPMALARPAAVVSLKW